MIRQECTYYPETYNLKSYKEYYDDNLIVHTEYDENRNKIYMEISYPNEPVQWMKRKFREGSYDDTGEVVWYEDEKGVFKHIYYENGSKIVVKNSFESITRLIGGRIDLERLEIIINNNDYYTLKLIAFRYLNENDYYYFTELFEYRSMGYKIEYYSHSFEEIYYEDDMNGRRIIHAEILYHLFPIKWLLQEYRINLHSKKYRVENRVCREFEPERVKNIPIYL